MKGRKPKPTALKQLAGNPGKRKVNRREPKPAAGIPACPPHLQDAAREEWERIVVQLARLKLLTQADRAALAAYCAAYGRWIAAEAIVAKGVVYTPRKKVLREDKDGNTVELEESSGLVKVNPAVRVAHDAMVLMHKFLSEFGLTPASRSRLAMTEDAPQDEYESFLKITG